MEPTLHIRFPDLSNFDSPTTVQTSSKATAIRIKNKVIVHYQYTMFGLESALARQRQENIAQKSYREIVDAFVQKCKQSLLFGKMQRIEELAADMHVSPKTLNRAFQSVFQGSLTPGRLLGYMRMAAAHRLLSRNNGGMVQQTAQSLGYADTSAFTKAYKNVLGHRPSQAHLFPMEALPPAPSEHVRN